MRYGRMDNTERKERKKMIKRNYIMNINRKSEVRVTKKQNKGFLSFLKKMDEQMNRK
jgi:hypothetical protein